MPGRWVAQVTRGPLERRSYDAEGDGWRAVVAGMGRGKTQ